MKGNYESFKATGRFDAFGRNLLKLMEDTHYWDHFPAENKRVDMMEFVEALVPQQKGPLGDCGVFLCMFMEFLACTEGGKPFSRRCGRVSLGFSF